jgi:hypothetical protein
MAYNSRMNPEGALMPACVAHYQFGQDILSRLGGELRPIIHAYKWEYDCGLQGPDIFYFYKPWRRTGIRDYGIARHNEPAARMFDAILATVCVKAALAYLIGLVCHYALDKQCHPYVNGYSSALYDHQRMESAFDRDTMSRAGLSEPRYRYLPVAGLDYRAIASLWPGIDAKTLRKCVRSERCAIRLLDRRRLLEACETVLGRCGALTMMTLPASVPEKWAEHVRQLRTLYERALDECPALIVSALEAMETKVFDGRGFDLNYKGLADIV